MAITQVREHDVGVYVWVLPNGKQFTNEDNEPLHIPARYGDIMAMAKLREAAIHYGQPEGTPKFIGGARSTSKSEWEDQMARMLEGKVPDPFDKGNNLAPGEV